MARRNEYTDTVRDLKALLRQESDEEKRRELAANLDKMTTQIDRQREQLGEVKVLEARIEGLTWLMRGVFVVFAMEIIAGVIVALLMKGHP